MGRGCLGVQHAAVGGMGGTKLVAHKMGNGRIDMELDSQIYGEGWFYVYDAGNDGVLSGLEDRVLFGGTKRDPNWPGCSCHDGYVLEGAKDVKNEAAKYEKIFADQKWDVVQYYARDFIKSFNSERLPPVNNWFFGEWNNFVYTPRPGLHTDGYRSVSASNASMSYDFVRGFKVKTRDIRCNMLPGEPEKALVDIDYESYPEGMKLLDAAAKAAYALRSATQVYPSNYASSDARDDNESCLHSSRGGGCEIDRHHHWSDMGEYLAWRVILSGIETTSASCGWSAETLTGLANWAERGIVGNYRAYLPEKEFSFDRLYKRIIAAEDAREQSYREYRRLMGFKDEYASR